MVSSANNYESALNNSANPFNVVGRVHNDGLYYILGGKIKAKQTGKDFRRGSIEHNEVSMEFLASVNTSLSQDKRDKIKKDGKEVFQRLFDNLIEPRQGRYDDYLNSLKLSPEGKKQISRLMIYFAAFDASTIDIKRAVERIAAFENTIQSSSLLTTHDKEVFFLHSAIGKHSMVYWSDFTKALKQKTLAVKDFSSPEIRLMDEQVKELPHYSLDQITVWATRDNNSGGGSFSIWPIITTNFLGQPYVSGIGGPGLQSFNLSSAEIDALIRYWNRNGTGGSSAIAAAVSADGSALSTVLSVASFQQIVSLIMGGAVTGGEVLGFAASSAVASGMIASSLVYWDITNNP